MSQTPPAPESQTSTSVAANGLLQAESRHVPGQRYSLVSRIRAQFYGRGTLFIEALFALLFLGAVFGGDILFLETHITEGLEPALLDTLKLLILQYTPPKTQQPKWVPSRH